MIHWTDFHQIFNIGRYLIIDCRFDPLFPMAQGTLPWQLISGSKLAKSHYSPLFVDMAFRNGLQYRHSDFKKFIGDDLATLHVNLVNFGLVTPEFWGIVGLHPLISNNPLRQIISGST